MRDAYAKAYEQVSADSNDGLYPLGNQIAADLVLSWTQKGATKGAGKALMANIDQFIAAADEVAARSTGVFDLAATVEGRLMRALADRKLDDKASKAIEKKFADALSRGARARKLDSMRTQFRFFRAMADTEFPAEERKQIVDRLKQLEAKLLG